MKVIWCLALYVCLYCTNISFALPKVETFPEIENAFSSDFSTAAGSRLPTAQDAHKWIAIKSTSIHLSWSDRFSIAINKAVTAYSVFLNLPQSNEKTASAIIHDTNYMNHKLSGLKSATKYAGELQAHVGPHKWPYKLLNFTVTTPSLLNGLEAAAHPKVSATSDISDLEGVSVDVQLRWTETPYKTDGIPPSEYLLKLWQKDQVLREEKIAGNSYRNEFMETIIGGLSLDRLYKITLEGKNSKGKIGITLSFSIATGSLFASESVFMTGGVAGCFSALQVRCPYSDRCVSPYWICDGSKDCPEGEDEDACDEVEPCQNGFRCWGSNKCLPASWRCDGFEDCLDGDDELGCSNCAGDDLLRCGTGSDCVSVGYACDGQKQCPDGWDETDAICNHVIPNFELGTFSTSFGCPNEKVPCGPSGGCVAKISLCDSVQDCPNGEDENDLFCQGYRNCTNMTDNYNNLYEDFHELRGNLLNDEDSEIFTVTQNTSFSDIVKIKNETTTEATLSTILQVPSTRISLKIIPSVSSKLADSLPPATQSSFTFGSRTRETNVSTHSTHTSTQPLISSTIPTETTVSPALILTSTQSTITEITQSVPQTSTTFFNHTSTSAMQQTPTSPLQQTSTSPLQQASTSPLQQISTSPLQLTSTSSLQEISTSTLQQTSTSKSPALDIESTATTVKLNGKIHTTKSSSKVIATSRCRTDEFDCGDGWCVPLFWICDGRFDCLDGADEDPKTCETIVEGVDQSIEENYVEELPFDVKCAVDYLQCSSGLCIEKFKICDGVDDCPGKEDEHSCVKLTDSPKLKVPFETESAIETHLEDHKPSIKFLDGNEIPTIDYDNPSFVANTFYDNFDGYTNSEGSGRSHPVTSEASTENMSVTKEVIDNSTPILNPTESLSQRNHHNYAKSEVILTIDNNVVQNKMFEISSEKISINTSNDDVNNGKLLSAVNFTATEEGNNMFSKWTDAIPISSEHLDKELDNNNNKHNGSQLGREQISHNLTSTRQSQISATEYEHNVIKDGTDYYFHSYVDYDSSEAWLSYDSNFNVDNDTKVDENVLSIDKNETYFSIGHTNNVSANDYHNTNDAILNNSESIAGQLPEVSSTLLLVSNITSDEFSGNSENGEITFNSSVVFNDNITNDTEIENPTTLDSNNVTFKISGTTSEDGFLVLSTSSTDYVANGNLTVLIAIHAESINGSIPEFVIHNTNGTQYNFDVIAVINKPLRRTKVDVITSEAPKSKYILEKVITFRLESNGKLQYNPIILNSPYNEAQPTSIDKEAPLDNQKYPNISCEAKNDTKTKESAIYFIDQIKPILLNLSTTKAKKYNNNNNDDNNKNNNNDDNNFQFSKVSNDSREMEDSKVNIITIIPSHNISLTNSFPTLRRTEVESLPNATENVSNQELVENFTLQIVDLTKNESASSVDSNNNLLNEIKSADFSDNFELKNITNSSASTNDSVLKISDLSSDNSQYLLSTISSSILGSDIISTEVHTTNEITTIATSEIIDSTHSDDYDYPDEWLEQKEHFGGIKFSQDLSNSIGSSSRDPDYVPHPRANERPEPDSSEDLYWLENENRDDANYLSNNIQGNEHDNHYYDLDYEMKNDLDPFGGYEDSNSIEPHAEQINRDYVRFPEKSSSSSLPNKNILYLFSCFLLMVLLLGIE